MSTLYYAGIGSRRTPPATLAQIERIATALAIDGLLGRSGHADGADLAWEAGATCVLPTRFQVFLPWPRFNAQHPSRPGTPVRSEPALETYAIAERFHPNWHALSAGARSLHARNVHQVLGWGLRAEELAAFVVCWTRDGAERASQCTATTGGTGGAIRLADAYDVPVFNLRNAGAVERLGEHVLTIL